MTADLKEFIKIYAKDNNLNELDAAMYAGALSQKLISSLDEYKKFVIVLNQVAPQLIQAILLAGKDAKGE